jgi:CDP-6-deoxy-D-xylo-4-hexulose-3-dehydrase
MRISYGSSVYSHLEIDAVNKVLKTSTQMGSNVINFEKKIAKIFGKKYYHAIRSVAFIAFISTTSDLLGLSGSQVIAISHES